MFDLKVIPAAVAAAMVPVPAMGRVILFVGADGRLYGRLPDGSIVSASAGAQGAAGAQGLPGAAGAQGPIGAQGVAGQAGSPIVANMAVGAYCMLSNSAATAAGADVVSSGGTLSQVSWTNAGQHVKTAAVTAGTYRCMGPSISGGGYGLFLRVA